MEAWTKAALSVLLVALWGSVSMGQTDTTSLLTQDEIRSAIDARARSIRDICVSFRETAIQRLPADAYFSRHTTITVKGVKTHMLLEDTVDAAKPEAVRTTEVAYNGQLGMRFLRDEARALVGSMREDWCNTNGVMFFDLMMLHAAWEDDPGGGHPASLLSIARAASTRLRPDVEVVDGQPCRVLDEYANGKLVSSVWLDCQRGFLPLRQRFYTGSGSAPALLMEFSITEAEQVQGLWFAVRGRKISYLAAAGRKGVSEQDITVDRTADGRPAIFVNELTSDDEFDLHKRLPPNIMVLNRDTGAGTVAAEMSPAQRPSLPQSAGPTSGSPRAGWWYALAGALMLAVLLCAAWWQAKRMELRHE